MKKKTVITRRVFHYFLHISPRWRWLPWRAADTVLDSAEAGAVAEGARRTR